jgi:tagaturonate reductase
MQQLSRALLEARGIPATDAPERVLQFGGGNFLRAFAENWIDLLNEKAGFNGKVVVVQNVPGHTAERLNAQQGLYTLLLRGAANGRTIDETRLVSCLSRAVNPYDDYAAYLALAANPDLAVIVSNTTEAGIAYDPACRLDDAPPASFPAKLAALLHRRFTLGLPGFLGLSCELIDHNGEALRQCVRQYAAQWALGPDFDAWLDRENTFCTTLVDRIVPGFPRDEAPALFERLGYRDDLLVAAEPFGFWAIEGDREAILRRLPFDKAGLPVEILPDITPYKQRKVRILNGAHTAFVLAAHLAGHAIVRECMAVPAIRAFLLRLLRDEVIPTLDLDRKNLFDFADAVLDRFANPFIDHRLLSIALNSTSKWKARCLPSLLEYIRRHDGALPPCLAFSLAAYIAFYQDGTRHPERTPLQDEPRVIEFFAARRDTPDAALVHDVLAHRDFWDADLAAIPGLEAAVAAHLHNIHALGSADALQRAAEA